MSESTTSGSPATQEFPCRQCGGKLTFSPGTEQMTCPYCGHVEAIVRPATEIVEHDLKDGLRRARRMQATDLVKGGSEQQCTGCGARAVMTERADHCAFCGSPRVVAIQGAEELIAPESLLPFAIDRRQAAEAFRRWVASRWFAPNDLARRSRTQGMDGVYLPYWTYDSRTTTHYKGMRGEHYYVTEHYTDSEGKQRSRQVRKTRWYPAAGTVRVDFDDVLVCASTSLPRPLVEGLEPWDLGQLVPYQPHYLSGFAAERYRVELEDGFARAQERMQPRIREAVQRDIGGDEQQILDLQVAHADTKFKHLLLPLWISSFRYGERVFRFMVNARTGEVNGERPWSAIKITLAVLLALLVAAGIAYAYMRLR